MRAELATEALNWRFKSLPGSGSPLSLAEIAASGWNILDQDVMLPAAVIRQTALDHNRQWMKRFTEAAGVNICPHGKTTMSPQLMGMQLEDGAWGITSATAAHVRTYRQFGIDRIILANQLIGKQNIAYILDELKRDPTFDFYCLVDSVESAEILEAETVRHGYRGRIQVLLELGMKGGRSGVRDDARALELAGRIAASPCLALRGIETFEGIMQGADGADEAMSRLINRVARLAEACDELGLFTGIPILSAGGSSFFDIAATTLSGATLRNRFEVVLRSGCYLVHDSDFYRELVDQLLLRSPEMSPMGEGLRPALELWACVLSRPEPSRAIVGLGKRDASFDIHLPRPVRWARTRQEGVFSLDGHKTVRLDDQHAYLDLPASSPLAVGDLVCFGISHPCTTFDRWPAIYLVDDALTVTGVVQTYF
jgi:D-serine dehydratase